MGYFIAIEGMQHGPFEARDLPQHGLRPDTLVWADGMPQWQRADSVPALQHLFSGGATIPPPPPADAYQPDYFPAAPPYHQGMSSNRVVAGVCGILIGALGIHKFILGYSGAGLIMLLGTLLTCGLGGTVFGIIGIIEGIIYLSKSEEEFYNTYVIHRREWF